KSSRLRWRASSATSSSTIASSSTRFRLTTKPAVDAASWFFSGHVLLDDAALCRHVVGARPAPPSRAALAGAALLSDAVPAVEDQDPRHRRAGERRPGVDRRQSRFLSR